MALEYDAKNRIVTAACTGWRVINPTGLVKISSGYAGYGYKCPLCGEEAIIPDQWEESTAKRRLAAHLRSEHGASSQLPAVQPTQPLSDFREQSTQRIAPRATYTVRNGNPAVTDSFFSGLEFLEARKLAAARISCGDVQIVDEQSGAIINIFAYGQPVSADEYTARVLRLQGAPEPASSRSDTDVMRELFSVLSEAMHAIHTSQRHVALVVKMQQTLAAAQLNVMQADALASQTERGK